MWSPRGRSWSNQAGAGSHHIPEPRDCRERFFFRGFQRVVRSGVPLASPERLASFGDFAALREIETGIAAEHAQEMFPVRALPALDLAPDSHALATSVFFFGLPRGRLRGR